MNWNLIFKYVAYAFLLLIYAAFAWNGKVPVEGFLALLGGVIASLGTAHVVANSVAAVNLPAQQPAPVVAPEPPAAIVTPSAQ